VGWVVGLEIKARSLLGSRYIRHLIEHKLRGNPAHSLQHVPQFRTDFQFARRTEAAKTVQTTCDNADQFPSRHCVVIRSTGLPQIQCSIFRILVSCAVRAGGIMRGSEVLREVQPLPQAARANDPERFVDSVVAAKFLSIQRRHLLHLA
jgi:hypothetical protein